MESDAIKELLLADGWEQITGADLAEGDYVAWHDDFDGWRAGLVTPPLDSKSCWWHKGWGSIKDSDVLLRRPEQFAHSDVRFDEGGHEHMNVSWEPRHPVYVNRELITPDLLVKDGTVYSSLRTYKVDEGTLTKEKPE